MTAKITGFISRAEAGLRSPRSVSKNITPSNGGVAPHYGGFAQSAAEPASDHSLCIKTWQAWQRYHMDVHGWVDLAYTGGVCNHGYAFAGRGAGIRTAANGTNLGNQNFYAVVWIGGGDQAPTQAAWDAMDWWIAQLRRAGAGYAVKPHKFFKSTACPGATLSAYCTTRDGSPISTVAPKPSAVTDSGEKSQVQNIQEALDVTADGKWGSTTDARARRMQTAAKAKCGYPKNYPRPFDIEDVQSVIGTEVDGVWGPLSQAALESWVELFQEVIGSSVDGKWGPLTDIRFTALRRKYHNNY